MEVSKVSELENNFYIWVNFCKSFVMLFLFKRNDFISFISNDFSGYSEDTGATIYPQLINFCIKRN